MIENANSVRVRYLSAPAPVRMANNWYNVAPLNHFWLQRRFEVLQRMAGEIIRGSSKLAEIGCGHGVVQRQIEDAYGKEVTGFDLNELPLKLSLSRNSPVCCYNIFDRLAEFKEAFDTIVLFDVLEHLEDEDGFLDALCFHLAPGGKLLLNVPAFESLHSRYDDEQGHVRRYDFRMLRTTAERSQFEIERWTYWGWPQVPLLLARKLWLQFQPKEKVVSSGFAMPGNFMNDLLLRSARMETIPQQSLGTSLMAVLSAAPDRRQKS